MNKEGYGPYKPVPLRSFILPRARRTPAAGGHPASPAAACQTRGPWPAS